jgi:hypothetical protein
MDNKSLSLIEIIIFDQMLPLVSGYLQAYACTDPLVEARYSFDKYATTVKTLSWQLVQNFSSKHSFLYAFSC